MAGTRKLIVRITADGDALRAAIVPLRERAKALAESAPAPTED